MATSIEDISKLKQQYINFGFTHELPVDKQPSVTFKCYCLGMGGGMYSGRSMLRSEYSDNYFYDKDGFELTGNRGHKTWCSEEVFEKHFAKGTCHTKRFKCSEPIDRTVIFDSEELNVIELNNLATITPTVIQNYLIPY